MADKSSFTPEEWKVVVSSPMLAGLAVTLAEPSGLWGMLKESMAGARALLVSHWYVDSEATVALITKSFDALKTDPKIGRAEALRRAMKALSASGSRTAHPSAWAPFVVVGEGGAGR